MKNNGFGLVVMKGRYISDKQLARIAKGDYASFRELFDIQYATVNRFVGYFLPTREDREEVVSEVFCILWRRREELVDIEDLNAWLFIISRNESYHYLKQKEKRRSDISIDELPIDLYVDTNEVDNTLLDHEMTEVYNKALSELPERCKLIFLLAREERMKHKEIAQVLSITEGTVEQQMNIAIRKMVDAVGRYYKIIKKQIYSLF